MSQCYKSHSGMTFSILDYLDDLEPVKHGKYICPACGGNDFTVNKATGAYNCWHDDSVKHRAEIRDALSPLTRWEKPLRQPGDYQFNYQNNQGTDIVIVHRNDISGTKRIWQDFPTIDKSSPSYKQTLQETKAQVLPYMYNEAVEKHEQSGLPIFIVEGELTCQAMHAVDLPAVTFLGGSKQYRTNNDYAQFFKNYKVVLCPDMDQQGVSFMAEVEKDNPGAQWLYANPTSFEWDNLPPGGGYDLADAIEEGAKKEEILSWIVPHNRHKGHDGKPSYDEILSQVEHFVGLYANDARITYETNQWLERHEIKMTQQSVNLIIDEARSRVYGKEEMDDIDALSIANQDAAREWLIAGIVPLGTVMLLAASGGTGKSTVAYNWALRIALGEPWSGRRCLRGGSLIIQSDEPLVDTSEKLDVIGYNECDLQPGVINFWENWRFGHMRQLEEYVKKHRPRFIAIDSLTACLAGMNIDMVKSNAGDMLYGLRDIANTYRCSILILHHLNKSGGLRDSTSFVDNVSEVIRLVKVDGSYDPDQFMIEWMKSRSGLTGKHYLRRDPLNYGWNYKGPINGTIEELDKVINLIELHPQKRYDKQQAALAIRSLDPTSTGKMLEVARRQGFCTSSWLHDSDGRKTRMYHSFDYVPEEPVFESVLEIKEPVKEEGIIKKEENETEAHDYF